MMLRIVRAGSCFGMILDREDWEDRVAHALDTLIVEISVRHFDFGRQAIGLQRKAVIMGSDFNMAVARIFNRLIAAAMTEHKFESLAAKRAPQQLMTKTNSE